MDIASVVVGAVIGAFASTFIRLFIENPLRALGKRAVVAWRRSSDAPEQGVVETITEAVRRRDEAQAEVDAWNSKLDSGGKILTALRSPERKET